MDKCKECGKPFDAAMGELFCCEGCRQKYEMRQQEMSRMRKEERAAAKAKKEEKKAEKVAKISEKKAKAEETSSRSLVEVKKICLMTGIVMGHRFYVGKWKSCLLIDFFWISAVLMSIGEFKTSFGEGMTYILMGVAIALAIWVFDFLTIISKRFTDGDGRTIRE